MSHPFAAADAAPHAIECLECGVICENDWQVISRSNDGWKTTAADLLPRCPGAGPLQAHHFAPAEGAIVCQWCQVEITPEGPEVPQECIRPE